MWNLKRHYTNKLIYKTETDSQPQRTNLWLLGGRMGEGIVREFGIDMYMLLYLKWITNKDRGLCSMLCGYQYIFLQRRHTAGQKVNKKFLTLFIVRKMQIKTTVGYFLTSVEWLLSNKLGHSKCWQGCGEKRILVHRWWECKLVQALCKTVWKCLKNIKHRPII